ncbi:aldo/keto reductase [Granulosicoccus antarcticus]|uniref:General stress protein 69 n=1 Tax=Granulosicoccus antarcticus IMCC3135 TaxID=1192854 RepID=A0A2Z2NI16_9GAMM|nr:aldo/keto reductase [Granulosicoccus antarcticus]ASJ70956.1 General stress protein 69 [Granulosicoccus antarcticus IMCC3135]
MQRRQLTENLEVSAMGLGCMGMSEFYGPHDDTESLQVLHRAAELGISFIDTADMYGPFHNEELIARFLKQCSSPMQIATKFGIVRKPGEYARTINNSAEYARSACEASLRRLGVDCIDLYYVHRIDVNQDIEVVMHALSALVSEGKIRHIGLCEVSAATLRRAHAVHPVAALQTEYSLWSRDVEADILPTCKELGIGFVPYSPLGRGFLTGTFDASGNFPEGDFRAALPRFTGNNARSNLSIVEVVHSLAERNNCTAAQVALAWLLSKGENIVPIPGTKRIAYLEENAAASDIQLPQNQLDELETSIAQLEVAGQRYTDEGMKGLNA